MKEIDYYLSSFKNKIQNLLDEVDYVVPTKLRGDLLLEELVNRKIDLGNKVVYDRFFDFVQPNFLANRKILLMDDIAVTGEELEKLSESLRKKGAKNIYKLAFLKRKTNNSELLQDVNALDEIDFSEYGYFVKELAKLWINKKPFYDNISFKVIFDKLLTADMLSELGELIEYDRNPAIREISLHNPFFKTPENKKFKEYDEPLKIRLRNRIYNPLEWRILPVIFCSLTYLPNLNELDSIEKTLFKIFSRDWHSEETRNFNLYESITLADRIIYAKIFIQSLSEMGINAKKIEPELNNLEKYYGEIICKNLKEIINKVFYDMSINFYEFKKSPSYINTNKIPNLIMPILTLLHENYKSDKNYSGLTIKEIANEIKEDTYTISATCEFGYDHGYLVPSVRPFSRTYGNSRFGNYILREFNKLKQ